MDKRLLLLFAIVGLFVHHAYFFYGHFGFDDLTYAEMADRFRQGRVDYSHPFSYRIVILGLTGLSYDLFGINDWASALPALGFSSFILCAFYLVFRRAAWWMLPLALAAYFGMRWNLFYSDKLMGDIMVSGAAFGGWVSYHWYRTGGRKSATAGILAAVCLMVSFCAKGNVVLLLPLLVTYGLYDLRRGRARFWVAAAATGTVLAVGYGLSYWWITGDALIRFAAIDNHHYLNTCSYDELPMSALVERLTAGFGRLLATSGLIPHAILALITSAVLLRKRLLRSRYALYPVTTLICLLSIEFMTISPTSYNPICEDPRHILLFAPIVTVCSVYSLAALREIYAVKTDRPWFVVLFVVVSAALLYPGLKLANYNRGLEYPAVKERFATMVEKIPKPAIVYGSESTRTLNRYFLQFESERYGLRFANYEDAPPCPASANDTVAYLARVWYTDWHSETTRTEFDDALQAQGYRKTAEPLGIEGIEFFRLDCE